MNEQDKNKEQFFWDECAKRRIYAAFDKDEYDRYFNQFLGDIKNKKVVDIGCASGISAILLALKGANVLGVDISPELIKQAVELAKESNARAEFKVGDAEKMDLPDGSMDAVFFGGVIHHFPEKTRLIDECRRVLKKGGKLLAIEPNRNDFFQRINWKIARKRNLLSVNEDLINPLGLKKIMEQQGFGNIQIVTFRMHLSFLGLLFPKTRKLFEEHGQTTLLEKILLFPVNIFRSDLNKGNFFVICGEKL